MEETQSIKKAKRSIKIYPIFASFTGDMIFFVPIDTLFLTLVKDLTEENRKCKFIKIRFIYAFNSISMLNIWK